MSNCFNLPLSGRLLSAALIFKHPQKTNNLAKATLRLLNAYESSTSFMSTSTEVATLEPSYKAGDVIGNWQVERILGTGGMGEVYLVNRTGADFEQTAALKLIRIDDPIYEKRFTKNGNSLPVWNMPESGASSMAAKALADANIWWSNLLRARPLLTMPKSSL